MVIKGRESIRPPPVGGLSLKPSRTSVQFGKLYWRRMVMLLLHQRGWTKIAAFLRFLYKTVAGSTARLPAHSTFHLSCRSLLSPVVDSYDSENAPGIAPDTQTSDN